jgi:hypothetical protein
MSDRDMLARVFGDFEQTVMPVSHLNRLNEAYATTRRRRNVRVTLSAAASIVVVVAAGVTVALAHGNAQPNVGTTVPTATPTQAASSSSPAPTQGNGQITMSELTAGPVPVPEWSTGQVVLPNGHGLSDWQKECVSGSTRLIPYQPDVKGVANQNVVTEMAYANLDVDPGPETAALVTCHVADSVVFASRLIIYDRTADGRIVTSGQILVGYIWHVKANPSGGIDVEVSDSMSSQWQESDYHQVRTYRWNGSAIVQTAGPKSFTNHNQAIDLRLELIDVKWALKTVSANGQNEQIPTATVTLRVTNAGPAASNPFVILPSDIGVDHSPSIQYPSLGASASTTITVVAANTGNGPVPFDLSVKELGLIGDADPSNNTVTLTPQTT